MHRRHNPRDSETETLTGDRATESERWVKLASYSTILQAEAVKVTLDGAGLPAILQSHSGAGLFGAGFQGPVPGGVVVLVRSMDLERAWKLVVYGTE